MSLGDRMKRYEESAHHVLVRRMPVLIRVDGRAFHTFTRGMPAFDRRLMNAMVQSAEIVAYGMQGFKCAYVQSDEVTFLLTDYDTTETQGWFDYDHSKMVSISAAHMTSAFGKWYPGRSPMFDSRAFNIPREDVVNAFLWRAKDWERNSLQTFARQFFSHKQLHKKGRSDMHEMLHGIGKNWATDIDDWDRNGAFIIKDSADYVIRHDILPSYDSINAAIGSLLEAA